MKLKATKTMAATLNKNLKNIGSYCIERFAFVEHKPDIWDEIYNEVEYNNEGHPIVKKIAVIYKPEMYAVNNYLTTIDLVKIFKDNGCKYIEDFASAVINELAI